MKKSVILFLFLISPSSTTIAMPMQMSHLWDFSNIGDGTPLSSVQDLVGGVYFDSGLDSQAIVNNQVLQYIPGLGTSTAVANVISGQEAYRWTVDFESFSAYEDAIGDGRRMHFGLYNSTENILSNVHPTSSVAQIRFLSTNPPSDRFLIRRFTTQGDSATFSSNNTLYDFSLSFFIDADSYEVTLTDNNLSTVLFSGLDTGVDDLSSISHFILSGTAFNGGMVQAGIRRITVETAVNSVPFQLLLLMSGFAGIVFMRGTTREHSVLTKIA